MDAINLLPWRQYQRQREKKNFLYLSLFSFVLLVLVVFLLNEYLLFLNAKQGARNQLLIQEISRLKASINTLKPVVHMKSSLLAKLTLVQDLQSTRGLLLRLLNDLAKITPDGVYISRLVLEKQRVRLWGFSSANAKISQLMKQIEANPWFQAPKLTEIKKREEKAYSAKQAFKLNFALKAARPTR